MQILADLARQTGPSVYAVRLAAELQRSREALVLAREEERRRIGRDLHDGLGPELAALAMNVEAARDLVAVDPGHSRELLSGLLEQTERTMQDVRRVAHELRPPVLDSLGLLDALRMAATNLQGVDCELDLPQSIPPVPAAVEVAAYRIAVEALRNVALHARARHCRLGVRHGDDGLRIIVRDDGVGIDPDQRPGVGLFSMQERAAELGGTCSVERDVTGTVVQACLPAASTAVTEGA